MINTRANFDMRLHFALSGLFLLAVALCLPVRGAETSSSIIDQAVSSSEVRSNLIAQYELAKADFKDDQLLAVAVSYGVNHQLEYAKQTYEAFLKDHPEHLRALRGLGLVNYLQNKFPEAINPLKKAADSGDVNSLGLLAISYYNSGKFEDLELLLPTLIKHKENNENIVKCLLSYALLKPAPRESLLLGAVDALPDKGIVVNEDIYLLVTTAIDRLRALDENNKTYQLICQKVMRGYLADTNAWPKSQLLSVANIFEMSGKCSQAESIYKQMLQNEPEDPVALSNLGIACLCQRKFPEAIPHLERAWKLGNTNALLNLAIAYYAVTNFEKLQELTSKLLEHKSENIEIVNLLISYALAKEPKHRALFYQAIEGLSDGQILRREDTAKGVILGLKAFGDEERIKRILELKSKLDKAVKI